MKRPARNFPTVRRRAHRQYLDCRNRPQLSAMYPICEHGPMRGVQSSLTGVIVAIHVPCEHCNGEGSPLLRYDDRRGVVCKDCDSALDEMFEESP